MRTTSEENTVFDKVIAEKLNDASGPVIVFLPRKGVSMLDVDGEDFYDPEADEALFTSIRENLKSEIELIEMNTDINDEKFALAMARKLDEYMDTEAA